MDTDGIKRITVCDQSKLEADIISKLKNDYKIKKSLERLEVDKRISSIDDDLASANNDLLEMESSLNCLLESLETDSVQTSLNRKIRNLELQIECKMRHIDVLDKRKIALIKKCEFLANPNDLDSNDYSILSTGTELESSSSTNCNTACSSKSKLSASPRNITSEKSSKVEVKKRKLSQSGTMKSVDDANLKEFHKRLKRQRRLNLLEQQLAKEHEQPDISSSDGKLSDTFHVPGTIWSRLYEFQKQGVRWLLDIHLKSCGGILGDEMGLGKTIQVIAFIAGLHYSQQLLLSNSSTDNIDGIDNRKKSELEFKSCLIICPATVLQQWMSELHQWWPALRVAILHSTGSGYCKPEMLIRTMAANFGSVLLTTYSTVVAYRDHLLKENWSYIILDEGHKIKNPNAEVTNCVKLFPTCHRLILSGTPIQNNLKELWSLFDFVCPGRLGVLSDFMQQFSIPITQGGYATASPLQVETAYRCVCTLRDLLKPYLIRRLKAEVEIQLPAKSEQVLFCRLTEYQCHLYKEYLQSQTCKDVLNGKASVFPSLFLLRNLCNHPDLATGGPRDSCFLDKQYYEDTQDIDEICSNYAWKRFGCPRRSSKLLVVTTLLRNWFNEGHKVLLFSQSRRMLNILERVITLMNLAYLRMDGSTPVNSRQKLIDQFNSEESNIFLFLLTTRVGGLGVNLTAADRVLIYDPDWNPTTDLQARERAWRIGQQRDVVIYRLLTVGTIEEKVYHRQIFKQFLTNRVLKNPCQQRFFKTNDLQELFTFNQDASSDDNNKINQTSQTALYVKSEGLGYTLSSSSSSSSKKRSVCNRFDIIAQKQKSKEFVKFDSDSEADDRLADDESVDEKDSRKQLLKEYVKDLSRRIAEGRLDNVSTNNKLNSSRKRSHYQRVSKGVRIDGKKIKLITKQCDYDTGEDNVKNRSITTKSSKKTSEANDIDEDLFVQTLFLKSGTDISKSNVTDSDRTKSIIAKRSAVDEDSRNEAIRVAEEVLANILKCSKQANSKVKDHLTISRDKRFDAESITKTERIIKKHKTNSIQKSDNNSSSCNSLLSNHVYITHTLQHDKFLDAMMDSNRTDTTFDRIEVVKCTNTVINNLFEEMNTSSQSHLNTDNESISILPNSEISNINKHLGEYKCHFLWNQNELSSPQYIHLLNSFGNCSRNDIGYQSSGNVRFSSCVLINLINLRKNRSLKYSLELNSKLNSLTVSDILLQRLCAKLLRLLKNSEGVSNDHLITEFQIFVQNKCNFNGTSIHINEYITFLHFRTLLKSLAVRKPMITLSVNKNVDKIKRLWILREKYFSLANFLSFKLCTAEQHF